MLARATRRFLPLLLALSSAAPALAAGGDPDPAARVAAEIARLRQSLKEKPIAGADAAGLSTACEGALKASAEALEAGRLYVSLESLGRAAELLQGARFLAEKEAAVAGGLPAFGAEWNKAAGALKDDGASQGEFKRSRAAVQALAETARGRIQPLLEGARGFAVATGPKDGL